VDKKANRPRPGDGKRTVSHTLRRVGLGQDKHLSLGPHAHLAFAREPARRKEAGLDSPERHSRLGPRRR
jgi:hypothetical protein